MVNRKKRFLAESNHYNLEQDRKTLIRAAKLWAEFGANNLGQEASNQDFRNLSGYLIFSCDKEIFNKVQNHFARFFNDLRMLTVDAKAKSERCFVMNLNVTDILSPSLGKHIEKIK